MYLCVVMHYILVLSFIYCVYVFIIMFVSFCYVYALLLFVFCIVIIDCVVCAVLHVSTLLSLLIL